MSFMAYIKKTLLNEIYCSSSRNATPTIKINTFYNIYPFDKYLIMKSKPRPTNKKSENAISLWNKK